MMFYCREDSVKPVYKVKWYLNKVHLDSNKFRRKVGFCYSNWLGDCQIHISKRDCAFAKFLREKDIKVSTGSGDTTIYLHKEWAKRNPKLAARILLMYLYYQNDLLELNNAA